MMQGLHPQQQQLAALLAAALPKDAPSPSPSTPTDAPAASATPDDADSSRIAAINSLHRAITYPPNSLLVAHSASFLGQGFSQLLSDKSYSVRQSTVLAYGALCAVVCSIPVGSIGRQNHVLLGSLVDRFIGWALPLLSNVCAGDGAMELALEGLREFLNVGDVGGIERYALPILKACQELLEDERTSLNLLHRLLATLTLISLKFSRLFQPHFLDIVDLLLGWAMVPDFAESDRRVIMDSFLQFQKHWVTNLQFSLGLLSKFLGDMDVLLQDGSHGAAQHFRRLLVLLSCFSTVLQSTASGLLEINLLEQIIEPLSNMLPQLLGCLSMVGQKFGWSIWIGDLWKCVTLLAEILCERFSSFYPFAVDILFQSLEPGSSSQSLRSGKMTSLQVHGVLKTNLQLLSLQKLGLMPSSVQKILKFDSPVSQLRLHPSKLVTGSSAATYVFLLQHGNDDIVQQAITLLTEELEHLKAMLDKTLYHVDEADSTRDSGAYSKFELLALFNFDLKVILTSVSGDGWSSLIGMPDINMYLKRSDKMVSFIIEKLNPFDSPLQADVELQVSIIKTLNWLSVVKLSSRCSLKNQICNKNPVDTATGKAFTGNSSRNGHISIIVDHFQEFGEILIKALHCSSPLAVKLVALEWVQKFCENLISINGNSTINSNLFEDSRYVGLVGNIMFPVLEAAFDTEPKVRLLVALVLLSLLEARLVHPMHFYSLAEAILEKLGDPDIEVRNAFLRLLSDALPTTVYICGLYDYGTYATCRPRILMVGTNSELYWKQAFALKPLPQHLHSQQLVSVLSYISQRWKVPLSSWIQRFVHTCLSSKDNVLGQLEDTGTTGDNDLWLDIKVDEEILRKLCSVNNLAGAWWAIHEAARYCISTRLRTNLGGPTQTFAAIERMLLDIAHVLQIDNEESDGGLSIIGSSAAHLLPMRLLLDFVEALKKNVYNAYEGSVVLPFVSQQSSLFFRTNKKVCEEWFSRICEPMMNAGLALQCHDAAVQYCRLRLVELKNLITISSKEKSRAQAADNLHSVNGRVLGDALQILRSMTLSMCKNHEPEALIGIQKWVLMKFSSLLVDENEESSSGVLEPLQWITGLIYQAEGRYEKAAAYFSHLLENESSLSTMGSDGVQFAIARIIESYSAVCDWKSLESWLLELQMLRSKFAGKSYSGALTTAGNEMNAIHALACFDEGDFQASWAYLDLTPKSSSELTLDPRLSLQRSEQMLLQALLHFDGNIDKVPQDLQKAKLILEEVLSVLPFDGLPEAAAYVTQLQCISAIEEGCELWVNQNKTKHRHTILSSYVLSTDPLVKAHCQDCTLWLKVLRVYRTISPTAPFTLKLSVDMLRLARKQGNHMLANRLHCYLRDNVHLCSEESYRYLLVSSLQYEEILLMFAENKIEEAFENIWSFLSPTLSLPSFIVKDVGYSVLKAKACLKLSCWLRENFLGLNLKNTIMKMHRDLDAGVFSSTVSDSLVDENIYSKSDFHVLVEEVVGRVTKLSTELCPRMGKAWIFYASWCFSQAKKLCADLCDKVCHSSIFSSLVAEHTFERFKLNEDEIRMVKSEIVKLFKEHGIKGLGDEKEVWSIPPESDELLSIDNPLGALLQKVVDAIEIAAGGSGAESTDCDRISSTLASQLLNILQRANICLEETGLRSVVDKLLELWCLVRKRRISLFGHAARGFIEYLSNSSSSLSDGQFLDAGFEPLKQKTGSYTLRATLYVLHILLKYGLELKETLEPALSAVPLFPWQEVTPQLFAWLSSHPKKVVRNQLEGLLMMLAKQSPWSIVYPTLVDVNASEENHSEELQHILGCLSELYPRLVQDVQLMIDELGNVTVLWEELWLSTLQDLHTDVIRRINVLKEEAARIAENSTLSQSEKNDINAAKYSAVMAPTVVALERRLASTSRKPETPHELWFHQVYKEQLKAAILTFKTPPVSASGLGDVWRPFENIAASLASQQRKSSISFQEVAPQLAMLSSSNIPMPGIMKQQKATESERGLSSTPDGIVTIASFSSHITILSTKTKPKKLVMLGSDGNMYTYLLKGREDLRLDARIMQLLQAVNSFLHSSSKTHRQVLGIRYYSVTPISGRAGLIQWVDNVISIYSIFKSWQNRVQLAQLSALGAGNAKSSAPPPVPRPSDMFYGKIIPALKEKGIRRVISRRDWPHEVKRKVLLDLMKEVPKQLLHQELWCASEGFKAFSSKLKRYSGSVATMSMVGHILGLGDRHLDNILLDFSSGEVVHIDYNVCFDKGQRLKVPEIVPFRLTQTIEAALGLTGIEGTFRANCEAVIGVLRKNKDIILMLLEVFVWDPLVEWTRGDFHDDSAIGGEERKGMELAVSLSLFATHVQEIRVPLQEHRDLLLGTLPAVESALEKFSDILGQYELASALFYRADEERSNLVQHETSAKSVVAEATCNFENIRASFEVQAREFAQAKTLISEKAQEASAWIEQHGRILDALRSNLIPEIKASMIINTISDQISLTSAVLAAGVPLTIVPEPTQAQCHDIDQEISHLISELGSGLSSAVTGIQAYSLALQRILPLNYLTTSVVHGWKQVLQLSVNTLSSEVLSLARRQAAELIARVQGDNIDFIKTRHDDLCVKVEKYAIEIQKLQEEHSELVSSIGPDNELKARDRLLSSFMQYMQSAGFVRKEDFSSFIQSGESNSGGTKDGKVKEELETKKQKMLSVLSMAANSLYTDIRHRVIDIFGGIASGKNESNVLPSDIGTVFSMFEEQGEKCVLVAGFFNELVQQIGSVMPGLVSDTCPSFHSVDNCAAIFKTILCSCRSFIEQMSEIVFADVMKFSISFNTEAMDAFCLISQIRGTIDTALEQLMEVELDRASLAELEQNYFVKVGLITERQLALEEAAMKGRDHLSWEEAEEIASQEEACRAQLDELHQSWNLKDVQTSSLKKKEAEIINSFFSCEHRFQSLISVGEPVDPHHSRSKALVAILARAFSELESVDKMLSSLDVSVSSRSEGIPNLLDLIGSGNLIPGLLWKFGSILGGHSFFIWKIDVLDSIIGSCLNDIASYVDQNLGFEQLFDVVKRKLEIRLHEQIVRYLKQRLAPALISWLDIASERIMLLIDGAKEHGTDQMKKDTMAVRRVQIMLEEYCNSHETVRAARSAASIMKKQENELKEALRKTILEIVQMEWVHDFALTQSHDSLTMFQSFFGSDDELYPVILNLRRQNLLDGIQSAMSKITRSIACLQSCERTSIAAEGQLERAMEWACGGPNSNSTGISSSKASGIPPQFHNHLRSRRQLLWEAREKASNIVKICISILEFEASRDGDGVFQVSGEVHSFRTNGDSMKWQQAYFSALTRLEVTYHSFTLTEQEWKLAESSMEAASNGLYSTTNELSIALLKAKSASGDLQSNVLAMRDCAYEVSVALSAFARVSNGHTALTSESGSMLEEVLAITEDLHDIHKLGKEAAAVHHAFMEGLSKINAILLPLESVLSKDVAAMTEAISREKETKIEVSPIHGQAIYQSYCSRVREASLIFKPSTPSLIASVEVLHSLLNKLAHAASLHAGNLNKVHEGSGESQEVKSQEVSILKPDFAGAATESAEMGRDILSQSDGDGNKDVYGIGGLSLQDKEWISPPNSVESSVIEFTLTSTGANSPDTLGDPAYMINHLSNHSDHIDAQDDLKSTPSQNDEILHPKQPEMSEMKSEPDEQKIYLKAVEHAIDEAVNSPVEPPNTLNKEIFKTSGDTGVISNKANIQESQVPDPHTASTVVRGKNAYALSVLERVEMKLDGRDIVENREISIPEQVDCLLKQATSIDNLCSMYEGWTPWI